MPDQERRKTLENKVLDKRIDMLGFIKVKYANPNGNPGEGNEPRMLLDGTGYMTDVSLKYKIRDWIEKKYGDRPGFARFIKSDGITLETKTTERIFEYLIEKGLTENDLKKNRVSWNMLYRAMTDVYFDLRMFGGVMTAMSKRKWTDGKITGPVQISYAESLDIINPVNDPITCASVASDKEKEEDGKEQNMGDKWIVPYAIYRFEVHVSGCLAEKIGMTEEDLRILTEAIWNMYDANSTSSKTGIDMEKLYVFRHDSKLGNCKFAQLRKAIETKADFTKQEFTAEVHKELIPDSVELTVMEN